VAPYGERRRLPRRSSAIWYAEVEAAVRAARVVVGEVLR
jgi:hypothetical protein